MKIFKNYKRNRVLIWILIITFLIMIFPVALKFSPIKKLISWYLLEIKIYIDSYSAMIGTLLGSFLAITGAIWTQRKFDKEKENEEVKKYSIIIRYDVLRGIDFVRKLYIEHYCKVEGGFWKVELSKKWIEYIAMISNSLKDDYIEEIYELYEQLNELLDCLEKLRLNTPKYVEESIPSYHGGYPGTYSRVDNSYEVLERKRDKLIIKIGQKVLNNNIKQCIDNDLESIDDALRLFKEKEEQISNYKRENDISHFADFHIDDEKKEYLEVLEKENRESWEEYKNKIKEIKRKWEENIDKKDDPSEYIDEKYLNILNGLDKRSIEIN